MHILRLIAIILFHQHYFLTDFYFVRQEGWKINSTRYARCIPAYGMLSSNLIVIKPYNHLFYIMIIHPAADQHDYIFFEDVQNWDFP